MKKSVLLIGPFLFSIVLQGGVKKLMFREKPVTKTVQFSVFKQASYSTKLYKQSKAKVFLSIWKCRGNNEDLVWSTTIDAGKLKDYPSEDNALFRQVSIHDIKEHKETLIAGYKIIYDSKGSELSYDNGHILNVGDTVNKLKIPL